MKHVGRNVLIAMLATFGVLAISCVTPEDETPTAETESAPATETPRSEDSADPTSTADTARPTAAATSTASTDPAASDSAVATVPAATATATSVPAPTADTSRPQPSPTPAATPTQIAPTSTPPSAPVPTATPVSVAPTATAPVATSTATVIAPPSVPVVVIGEFTAGGTSTSRSLRLTGSFGTGFGGGVSHTDDWQIRPGLHARPLPPAPEDRGVTGPFNLSGGPTAGGSSAGNGLHLTGSFGFGAATGSSSGNNLSITSGIYPNANRND